MVAKWESLWPGPNSAKNEKEWESWMPGTNHSEKCQKAGANQKSWNLPANREIENLPEKSRNRQILRKSGNHQNQANLGNSRKWPFQFNSFLEVGKSWTSIWDPESQIWAPTRWLMKSGQPWGRNLFLLFLIFLLEVGVGTRTSARFLFLVTGFAADL